MSKIFFTSDHHFGHTNIIKFSSRPFLNLEEMNEVMIARWNEKIGPNDLDVTWDDNIMYLIDDSLNKAGAYIKNRTLETYPLPGKNDEVQSYQLTLMIKPPGLDLYCIAEELIKEHFQKGLCIKLKSEYHGFEVVYEY